MMNQVFLFGWAVMLCEGSSFASKGDYISVRTDLAIHALT